MKATIEELHTFITIVETGSIVEASLRLSQTTSSVSRTLKRLEQKLNVTLLERTTRTLQLTDSGSLFLEYSKEITQKLTEAEDAVLQADINLSGIIRIDAATPFVLHSLTQHIVKFTTKYPQIKIELSNHEHIIDLLKEQIDIAIRIGDLEDSNLQAKILMQSPLHIIASPQYLDKFGTPNNISELKQHHHIGFTHPSNLNKWPIYDGNILYKITPLISATNGEVIRNLTLQGAGISCLSDFMVKQDIKEGKLISILNDQTEIQMQKIYAVYYKKAYMPKRNRLLIDFLAAAFKDAR